MKKLISLTFVLLFVFALIPTKVEAKILLESRVKEKCRTNSMKDYEVTNNKCRIWSDLGHPLCDKSRCE